MASHKKSALAKQRERYLGGSERGVRGDGAWEDDVLGDLFMAELQREKQRQAQHEHALYQKACASKNRYATKGEAQDAAAQCAEHGRRGLRVYRCEYCKGWHLTSKPQGSDDPE